MRSKSIKIVFFLVFLTIIPFIKINVFAADEEIDFLKYFKTDSEYYISNDFIDVYGNKQIYDEDFYYNQSIIKCKSILVYRTNNKVEMPYDLCYFHYYNGKVTNYAYLCSSGNNLDKIRGINNYLKCILIEYIKNNNLISFDNRVNYLNDVPATFIDSVATTIYTIDFPKKGYITSRIALNEYRATSNSSIFIVNVKSTFVPGVVAYENGLSYDKWKNHKGYVHMTVEQAYDANESYYYGLRYGAVPYIKDYWPNNYPSTVIIGSSIDAGVVLGYSTENGFAVQGDVSYSYSKSITISNPYVNAQLDNTGNIAMWSYEYDKNRPWSYDQESNYMYEISTNGREMLYGDVRLKLDYYFQVDRDGFYVKQNNYHSLDLIARPSNSRIYGFCSGMI